MTIDGNWPGAQPQRRAVLVTNGLVVGGAETQTVLLAEALVGHGYEVGVLSILPTGAFEDELAELGVPIAEIDPQGRARSLAAIRGGRDVLRAWRPDVVVSFVYQANVLGRIAGRLTDVPVIISSIRNEYLGGRMRDVVMRVTEPLCTMTTTNSELTAEELVGRRVVSRARLTVIPNGLDTDKYRTTAEERAGTRRALGVRDDEFLWLAAGRLERQKDFSSLLRAFASLDGGRRARLAIAGQGPLTDELETLIADLRIGHRAQLLGLRGDIPALLGASDALVLSSAWEGLPNIVMEAMAASRPVVATRVGGVAELVEDDKTGYTVVPNDTGALAVAMRAAMSLSEAERKAFGERGRKVVVGRFSAESVGLQWLALIDEWVGRKGVRPGSRASLGALRAFAHRDALSREAS